MTYIHPHTLRDAVQDMRPLDALEYALDAFEQVAGQTDADLALGLSLGLTPQQAAIFGLLHRDLGMPVGYERVHAVMDTADVKGFAASRVRVSYIRRKLAGRYTIKTVWGFGYQMERA